MVNYGDMIHDALRTRVLAGSFPEVTYPDGKTRATSASVFKLPRTLKIDMRSSTFDTPAQNRQSRYVERTTWVWVVEVAFDRAVSFEEFERDIAENPPRITRAQSGLPRQVDIFLEEAEDYVHPPRKSPSTGSRATWRFAAELSPS